MQRDPKWVFYSDPLCDKIHKVGSFGRELHMDQAVLPVFLFAACATIVAVGLVVVGALVGPHKDGRVKEMPYESGMDPIHDARRRFDVRFYLVAIAFLVFDVELLFLYPWAVASRNPQGIDQAVAEHWVASRGLVFAEVLSFVALLAAGYVYAWRKGVFRWR
jgi:NADH-quinone oxidoreductase subunit A